MKGESCFLDQTWLAATIIIVVGLTGFDFDQKVQILNSTSSSIHVEAISNNESSLSDSNSEFVSDDKVDAKKVIVGDIEVAYKTFGMGAPILLISGRGNV